MSQPELAYIDVGERAIAYRIRSGRDPTLLFLPGYSSDMEGAKALALDAFAEQAGLAMLRLDYSGTGSSGGDFEDGTLARWIEETLAAIDRLTALGHDVSHLRSKSWDEFKGPDAPRMDFIIALCDAPNGQVCPDLGTQFVTGAWPLPDPAQFTGSSTERTTLLNELYAMIRRRVEIFTSLPFDSLDRMAVKARLDEIVDTTRVSP